VRRRRRRRRRRTHHHQSVGASLFVFFVPARFPALMVDPA
jgi:hypothetical protein